MRQEYKILEDCPDVMTFKQLKDVLNISRNKCYALLQNQEIKHRKIGSVYRIPKNNVLNYLENQF